MSMPNNLFLVRHGESEGNVALKATDRGDHSFMTHEEFVSQHSSKWRLTARGRAQAEVAGQWFRENYPGGLDFYFTSEYARSMETAALMGILGPQGNRWRISPYLRERYWGELDRMTADERNRRFAATLRDASTSPFYWRPPNGEAFVDVAARVKWLIGTMARTWCHRSGVLVCHGEVIEAIRIELERLSEKQYIDEYEHPENKVRNCDIIHYTRIDEEGDQRPYFFRKRVISNGVPGEFETIVRQEYSDEDLLEMIDELPLYFEDLLGY